MPKAAIVVLADTETPGDLGRVVKALSTSKEFQDAGDDVRMIFDGAGTKWVGELAKPAHRYNELFEEVKDTVEGACAYCAMAFGVVDEIASEGVELVGDRYHQHASLRDLASRGYEVITF